MHEYVLASNCSVVHCTSPTGYSPAYAIDLLDGLIVVLDYGAR
jgi:hypothetical protein